MSDVPAEPSLEQRLGLVLRGVQAAAEGLDAVEARLPELATAERLKTLSDRVDEYRVRSRAELAQVGEVVGTLARALDVVLRDQQALAEEVRTTRTATPVADDALQPLTDAVGALRDDLGAAHDRLAEDTRTAVERVAGQQAERAVRLLEAVGEAGDRTVAAVGGIAGPGADVVELAGDLRQLRTTLDGRHVVLSDAVAGVREELLAGLTELRAASTAGATPPSPAPVYDDGDVRSALGGLRDDLRRLQGELLETTGQLRTDMAARDTSLRDEIVGAVERRLADVPLDLTTPVEGIYDRLGGIEWRLGERLDPLADRLTAIEARLVSLGQEPGDGVPDRAITEGLASLRAGLEQVAQREDLRRGVDRVLGAVSSAEEAVSGEVRAVDARVGALADDVRLVRVLRDGLDALAASVDGVRQVASRSATSQQMSEVTRELGSVLAEIESARSQVLRVEQSTSPVAAEVVAVGGEVDDLGHRIDMLAEVIEAGLHRSTPGESVVVQQMAQRLRQASASARVLGGGVLDDLRSRRGKRR